MIQRTLLIALFLPFLCFGVTYQAQDVGNLKYDNTVGLLVNDNGQALIKSILKNSGRDESDYYLFDLRDEPFLIMSQLSNAGYIFTKLSNAGWIIGVKTYNERVDGNLCNCSKPFIFTKEKGIQLIVREEACFFKDINSSNVILGDHVTSEGSKIFLYQDDTLNEVDIGKRAQELGYDVTDCYAKALSDRGEILGSFKYQIQHPTKPKQTYKRSKQFFYDGELTIIDINEVVHSAVAVSMNNLGQVAMNIIDLNGDAFVYVWDHGSVYRVSAGIAARINDNSEIQMKTSPYDLAHLHAGILQIFSFRELEVSYLNYGALQALVSNTRDFPFTYNGFPMSLNLIPEADLLPMSNNGSLLAPVKIWGESHALLLTPEK